eukprot:TRINITY_DN6482_c0_g4_i1.p1 TRINITY_DN6482_c0_g4~~TRINITY_DN6482_c0_g4_i1.p1  ORF type:complete len:380 (-),score=123.59 TRINITY_DN6482_c0_g4_i1:136-1275(-)
MSKLFRNYAPAAEPMEESNSSALKLSFTIGPSGAMSLKPAAVASEPMQEIHPAPEAADGPAEKWKHWVRKIVKKLSKRGDFAGNPEFSLEMVEGLLVDKSPEIIKEYLLPILESLPSPEKVLKRWNKKWDKLQAKTNRTISIRFGPPDPLVENSLPVQMSAAGPTAPKMTMKAAEKPESFEEQMEDLPQTKVIIKPPETASSHKIKLTLGGKVFAPTPEPPAPEEHEETKVVIKNVDLVKMLNEDKQNRATKAVKPKGALSVTLPSLESIQKVSTLMAAAQQMQTDAKLKNSYSLFSEFPIDAETRASIDSYITKTLGKLRREVEAMHEVKKVQEVKSKPAKVEPVKEGKRIRFQEFRIVDPINAKPYDCILTRMKAIA